MKLVVFQAVAVTKPMSEPQSDSKTFLLVNKKIAKGRAHRTGQHGGLYADAGFFPRDPV